MHKEVSIQSRNGRQLKVWLDRQGRSKKIIIFGHGFAGDKSEEGKFDKAAAALQKKGFSTLRFDFSGCGESSDVPHNTKQWSEDLQVVVDHAKKEGFSTVWYLGYSMGGLIGLRNADLFERMLLWAPLTGKVSGFEKKYPLWKRVFLFMLRKITLKRTMRWRNSIQVSSQMVHDIKTIDQSKLLARIDIPIHIIHGTKDETIPLSYPEHCRETLPHCTLETLDDGHKFYKTTDILVKKTVKWFSEKSA
ncbi:MAG: alpha/beta hydrolase [Nanoarchaeota archaeon]